MFKTVTVLGAVSRSVMTSLSVYAVIALEILHSVTLDWLKMRNLILSGCLIKQYKITPRDGINVGATAEVAA